MAQGTARGPSDVKDPISPRPARPAEAPRADALSHTSTHGAESIAFLETAARHLRDAGYSVDLDFDHEAQEACLYVDGIEVRFVRALSDVGALKH